MSFDTQHCNLSSPNVLVLSRCQWGLFERFTCKSGCLGRKLWRANTSWECQQSDVSFEYVGFRFSHYSNVFSFDAQVANLDFDVCSAVQKHSVKGHCFLLKGGDSFWNGFIIPLMYSSSTDMWVIPHAKHGTKTDLGVPNLGWNLIVSSFFIWRLLLRPLNKSHKRKRPELVPLMKWHRPL